MPDLYFAPCVVYGATTYYLPPFIEANVRHRQANDVIPIPLTDSAEFGESNLNLGTRVDLTVSGKASADTQAAVLAWMYDIWNNLSGRTFTLFIFSDRGLTNCRLDDMDTEFGIQPLTMLRNVGLSIVSTSNYWDTSQQLSFDDYEEDYPYAAYVGRPAGSAVSPGGGATPIMEAALQRMSSYFIGIPPVASSGDEKQWIVGGSTGSTWKGIKLEAQAQIAGSSNTVLTFSTTPIGGMGGQQATITLAGSSKIATAQTIDIDLTTGDTVYVWVSTSGGHANIEAQMHIQAQ